MKLNKRMMSLTRPPFFQAPWEYPGSLEDAKKDIILEILVQGGKIKDEGARYAVDEKCSNFRSLFLSIIPAHLSFF